MGVRCAGIAERAVVPLSGCRVTSFENAKAFSPSPNRRVVPLLSPIDHGVPFALNLVLEKNCEDEVDTKIREDTHGEDRLYFLLRGNACVSDAGCASEDADAADVRACGLHGGLSLQRGDSCFCSARSVLRPQLQPSDDSSAWAFAAVELRLPRTPLSAAGLTEHWRSMPPAPSLGPSALCSILSGDDSDESVLPPAPPARRSATFPQRVRMRDADVFALPGQTNRVALMFDQRPGDVNDDLCFGFESFEPGHVTPRHSHTIGTELFVVLRGTGRAECDGASFPVSPGSVVAFNPGCVHAIDVDAGCRMDCIELLFPGDGFAKYVRSGSAAPGLHPGNALASMGCGSASPHH